MSLVTAPNGGGEPLFFVNFNSTEPSRGARGSPSVPVDYIFVAANGRHRVDFQRERLLYRDGLVLDGRRRLWLSEHLPLLHQYVLAEEIR